MSKKESTPRAPVVKSSPSIARGTRGEPFSKWQKLVASRMQELGISTRALAAMISTPSWSPENTTVWAWTRCKDGCPPKDSYSSSVNERMANALELDPDVLAAAYEDARRHLVVATESPQRGQLSVLRMMFLGAKQSTWKREEIISIIDQIQGL